MNKEVKLSLKMVTEHVCESKNRVIENNKIYT